MLACFIGYIVQAVVNNFTPLLFVNFQTVYGIPLAKITLLITINFLIQLCVDLVSAWLLDRIGYRAGVVFAHVASAAGLSAPNISVPNWKNSRLRPACGFSWRKQEMM